MEIYHLRRLLACAAICLCPYLCWGLPNSVKEREAAERVIAWSNLYLYVREATGNNDGPEIDKWNKALGIPLRSYWCASYQAAGQRENNLPYPAAAGGSYNWFKPTSWRTYYIRGKTGSPDSIRPGHHVGFFYTNLKRIGHMGRVISPTKLDSRGVPRGWNTNEGNTGSGGGRNGAGVHQLMRAKWEFYAASNWLIK